MQKTKIGNRAKFRARNKYFLLIIFPVRAILRKINFRRIITHIICVIFSLYYKDTLEKVTMQRTQQFSAFVCFLGSRDGAVVEALASHQCGPGSIPGPGVISGLSLLLVRSLPFSEGFSPGSPGFFPQQTPTLQTPI